jgi:hypothetical protein
MGNKNDIPSTAEQECVTKLKLQIDHFDQLYNNLVDQIKKCAETDRVKAESVFEEFFTKAKSSDTVPMALPGICSACNQAMTNLLNSTQRLKELLQEVGKTKSSLEDAFDLANGGGNVDPQSFGVFDRRKVLSS